jgi:hypothetical protein
MYVGAIGTKEKIGEILWEEERAEDTNDSDWWPSIGECTSEKVCCGPI